MSLEVALRDPDRVHAVTVGRDDRIARLDRLRNLRKLEIKHPSLAMLPDIVARAGRELDARLRPAALRR